MADIATKARNEQAEMPLNDDIVAENEIVFSEKPTSQHSLLKHLSI